ncbi:hypothetical protein LSUE1_G008497, partial [Lachnellula suecica]
MDSTAIPPKLAALLDNHPSQRTALLTCGLTGAGKSTLARAILSQYLNFVRLSIDSTVLRTRGVYRRDYAPELRAGFQEEAEVSIKSELKQLLEAGKKDVVLDMAFYARETRDEYRGLIEKYGRGGYRVVLVVLR